jgi:hypothetical protein
VPDDLRESACFRGWIEAVVFVRHFLSHFCQAIRDMAVHLLDFGTERVRFPSLQRASADVFSQKKPRAPRGVAGYCRDEPSERW